MNKRRSRQHAGQPEVQGGLVLVATALFAISLFAGCAAKPKGVTPIPAQVDGRSPTTLPFGGIFGHGRALFASPDQELWVISRSSSEASSRANDTPGAGAMLARWPEEQKQIPLPLKHTDVQAFIGGCVATVEVTQSFHNPYQGSIEAVYVFALPHNAAVNEFVMTIGERRIRGIIRERREAERIYFEARRQGYVASLLTEERPNIFTQSVANIEPGREIDVSIKYFHTLAYLDGWYEFVFPMVVGPRFNPPQRAPDVSPEGEPAADRAFKNDGIGAVAPGAQAASSQQTRLKYLRPNERSGHDISLKVEVDAGVAIEESVCRTHIVGWQKPSPRQLVVTLSPEDRMPNKDFVLRYRVAGEGIKSGLLTWRDARGGYFAFMLYPPRDLHALRRLSLEMVFVLDCSGSMSGRPLAQAKSAIQQALRHLQPGDTFQLIRFSDDASQFGTSPLPATPENVRRGLDHLRSLNGEGGTMMLEGIKAALDFPHDPDRLRFVCFLTDGYIGNEAEILAQLHKRIGPSRLFSFGVGTAVNRYLLEHMAILGRGAVAYLGLNDDPVRVMNDFFERISHPALTDLQINWSGRQVAEVCPEKVPDLFVGRPVILTGRFNGGANAAIRVSGKAAGQPVVFESSTDQADASPTHKGLPGVWARAKIADLADRMTRDPGQDFPEQIKQVALDYGMMSPFTAFVSVDSTRRAAGKEGTTVPLAVPVPNGVKYETTVPEEE